MQCGMHASAFTPDPRSPCVCTACRCPFLLTVPAQQLGINFRGVLMAVRIDTMAVISMVTSEPRLLQVGARRTCSHATAAGLRIPSTACARLVVDTAIP